MFTEPSPVSAVAATIWIAMTLYVVASVLRALLLAWLDRRTPQPGSVRFRVPETERPRAAA